MYLPGKALSSRSSGSGRGAGLLHGAGGPKEPVQAQAVAQAAHEIRLDHLPLLAGG